ncbi:somatomedin-B and thrombospondin type-1 domain-containing protein isoform X4 [Alligator mississippiensis]|uniref:somatomedin-B and thrombospondin type-1 domain-containing protein isoform X4 n=1 Tax=Alligator mississippiensis TaxID=8496 RepID=UPI0009072061|nr:somatomedin-B and thrombospondin type-1 domain-containing protein isoform X4 [Alligator mississippiensis]
MIGHMPLPLPSPPADQGYSTSPAAVMRCTLWLGGRCSLDFHFTVHCSRGGGLRWQRLLPVPNVMGILGRRPVDCMVGPWGPWSKCSSLCGVGSKDRTRQVTVPPRNGGTPCPDLKQRRGCFGDSPVCDTAKEVAKILPDSYKRDFKDPWRRPHMLMKEKQPSYCVYFRLKQVGAACRLHFWSSHLLRERRVCVECQGDAVGSRSRCEGDGLQGARTFWTAASIAGCQGSWVQESLQETCMCPPLSLLFV